MSIRQGIVIVAVLLLLAANQAFCQQSKFQQGIDSFGVNDKKIFNYAQDFLSAKKKKMLNYQYDFLDLLNPGRIILKLRFLSISK